MRSDGVASFESFDGAQTDIFVYVIATNTVYRVADTPNVNEVLNDVDVSPGEVHVTWAPDESSGAGNTHDIHGRIRDRSLDSHEGTEKAKPPHWQGLRKRWS